MRCPIPDDQPALVPTAKSKSRREQPTMDPERALGGVVAGVDEVGRAPLAGPVVAAAVVLPPDVDRIGELQGIDDSKRVAEPLRARLAEAIRARAHVGLGAASVAEIDRLNIHHASLLAMRRAVATLRCRVDGILVDGIHAPVVSCRVNTLVGGDGLSTSVAAASIVAKVTRDRLMARLDERHPGYGWTQNVGYPTEEHTWGLLRLGPCRHHRMSFSLPRLVIANPGLGLRFGPRDGEPAMPLQLLKLRENLYAIADAEGWHLGALRASRGRWMVQAIGYDKGAGAALTGHGPLALFEGETLLVPSVEALRARLAEARLEPHTAQNTRLPRRP